MTGPRWIRGVLPLVAGVNVIETKEAEPESTPEDAQEEPEGEESDTELMEVQGSAPVETKKSERWVPRRLQHIACR
jgi:hypothetical protein